MKKSKVEIIDLSEIQLSNLEIQDKLNDIIQRHRPTKVYSVTGGNEKTTSRVYQEV